MKTIHRLLAALPFLMGAICLSSCTKTPVLPEDAILAIRMGGATRLSLPDTSDFILRLYGPGNKTVYDGPYGNAPSEMQLSPGNYRVEALSCSFSMPAFDCPQFGDEQSLSLGEGEYRNVELLCRQRNAGVRLIVNDTFVANYVKADLYLRSADGTLMYDFRETRTAFFKPGPVALMMNDSGKSRTLFTRNMDAGEMLLVELSASEHMPVARLLSGGSIEIAIDTTRKWTSGRFAYDGGATDPSGDITPGGNPGNPFSVAEARRKAGSKDVWVCGYIVGGDLSSKGWNRTAPFQSRTNLAIADSPTCTERDLCLSVMLPKGDIRDALNLVDNDLLWHKVLIKGSIVEAYYGLPGLQSLKDYRL